MDTFVEKTGTTEKEEQIPIVRSENEKQIQVPAENAEQASAPIEEDSKETTSWEGQGKEPERQIKIVRTEVETPDPLGRKIASLPKNEMKAGYDYAFGKGRAKR